MAVSLNDAMSCAETTAKTKPFRIMDLPPELRLHIYDKVIPEHTFVLVVGGLVYHDKSGSYAPGIVSLLRTCKTIHREALPILFEKSTLDIQLWDPIAMAECHKNVTVWKLLGGVAGSSTLRCAERVTLSVSSDYVADNMALADTTSYTLVTLDYCRGVKRLDIIVEVDEDPDAYEFDYRRLEQLVEPFMSVQCTGTITSRLEIMDHPEVICKGYQELVKTLNAEDVSSLTGLPALEARYVPSG